MSDQILTNSGAISPSQAASLTPPASSYTVGTWMFVATASATAADSYDDQFERGELPRRGSV